MEEGKSNYQESGKLKILTTIDGSLFWEPFLLRIADCGLSAGPRGRTVSAEARRRRIADFGVINFSILNSNVK
jgi:hypothetical protein